MVRDSANELKVRPGKTLNHNMHSKQLAADSFWPKSLHLQLCPRKS